MPSEATVRHQLADMLGTLASYQGEISSRAPDWDSLTQKQRMNTMLTGLFVETGELFNAMRVKWWRPEQDGPSTPEERAEVALEFADVLATLGAVVYLAKSYGVPYSAVARAYVEKSETNLRRFRGDHSDRCKKPPCPWDHPFPDGAGKL